MENSNFLTAASIRHASEYRCSDVDFNQILGTLDTFLFLVSVIMSTPVPNQKQDHVLDQSAKRNADGAGSLLK